MLFLLLLVRGVQPFDQYMVDRELPLCLRNINRVRKFAL